MEEGLFKYGGAKSLVALHERHLREFLQVWREAEARELVLSESPDPNYASRVARPNQAHDSGTRGRRRKRVLIATPARLTIGPTVWAIRYSRRPLPPHLGSEQHSRGRG